MEAKLELRVREQAKLLKVRKKDKDLLEIPE